jgi:hypothetical protein
MRTAVASSPAGDAVAAERLTSFRVIDIDAVASADQTQSIIA